MNFNFTEFHEREEMKSLFFTCFTTNVVCIDFNNLVKRLFISNIIVVI